MIKNPRNLLIFAVLGGAVGLGLGLLIPTPKRMHGVETDIRTALATQTAAWNEGDIQGYMDGYLRSEGLRFASGGDVENGWKTTLERYQRRYPDRAAMGTLITENFDVTVIDAENALVFGSWELDRAGDNPSGLYTLHLKKHDGHWLVVSDHTSSAN